jgi:orotate phosphoribosyltransferase
MAPAAELPPLSPALEVLRAHVLRYSLKRGRFTLKSGATSTWFLDTKQTACRADGILAVTDALVERLGPDLDDVDAIGGLTMGADPVAFGVAAVLATRGGRVRSFAGALEPGDRVLVTEDTTTRGTSLMEAADQVQEFGARPVLMCVIVDRGGTCAEMAAAQGIDYRPLLTAPDLGFPFGT